MNCSSKNFLHPLRVPETGDSEGSKALVVNIETLGLTNDENVRIQRLPYCVSIILFVSTTFPSTIKAYKYMPAANSFPEILTET